MGIYSGYHSLHNKREENGKGYEYVYEARKRTQEFKKCMKKVDVQHKSHLPAISPLKVEVLDGEKKFREAEKTILGEEDEAR